MQAISITIAAIAVSIAAATFIWRVLRSERSERRRKQELVNAVYHHVDEPIDRLDNEEREKRNETIHATEESFDSDYVRSWPVVRKLQLWNLYVKYQEETLRNARAAREVLGRGGKLSENNGKEN